MAGFRTRAGEVIDLRVVPYSAVTVVVDLGESLVVVDDRPLALGRPHRLASATAVTT